MKPFSEEKKEAKKEKEEDKKLAMYVSGLYNDHPVHEELTGFAYLQAFHDGFQYVKMVSDSMKQDRIEPVPQIGTLKHRTKINETKKVTEIGVAKILKSSPLPQAAPTSDSRDDERVALSVSRLLKFFFTNDRINLSGKRHSVKTLAYVQGTGWLHPYWDPTVITDGGAEGEVGVKVLDNFTFFPDPDCTDYTGMKWGIIATMETKKWVKTKYGKNLEERYPGMEGKYYAKSNNAKSHDIKDSFGDKSKNKITDNEAYDKNIFVLEYWESASEDHKSGRLVTVINETFIAVNKDNRYAKKANHKYYGDMQLPFVPEYFEKLSDSIYGKSRIKNIVGLNKELNYLASLTMQTIKRVCLAKILLPKSAGVKADAFNSEIGEFITWNDRMSANPPGYMKGTEVPSSIAQQMSFLLGMIMDVSGHHELSMGQLPERGSQMTGPVVKVLEDGEFLRSTHAVQNDKWAVKKLGKFLVALAQDYYKEPRMISILGENGVTQYKDISQADLMGNVDITLEVGALVGMSQQAQREFILQMIDRNLPQRAAEGDVYAARVLELMGQPGATVRDLMQQVHRSRAKAEWELEQILKGVKVYEQKGDTLEFVFPIYPYDDHKIISEVLIEYSRTHAFYAEATPVTQQRLIEVIEAHQELLLKQQQQQLEAQQPQQQPPPQGQPVQGQPTP